MGSCPQPLLEPHFSMPRHQQSGSNSSWDPAVLLGEEEVGGGSSRDLVCSEGWVTGSHFAGQQTAGPQMESRPARGFLLFHLHQAPEGTAPIPQKTQLWPHPSATGLTFFSAKCANQKAPTSEVEERKGIKSWMGRQTREGLERVTSYPLIPANSSLAPQDLAA